ncbi:hypothetical protein ACH5RR_000189 [Cinchona calisaya]|uniref:Uncharacterized protein n=1 Tax=Cinchona calisaya TaxID=153742 RepID=A0ABD3B0L8_9GENT
MATQAKIQEALERNDVELEEEDDEIEKLQAEVKEMAEKILNFRITFPGQLKSILSSILASQRPILLTHFDSGSDSHSGSSNYPNPDVVRTIGSGDGTLLTEEDQETEKIKLLKQKISSNASTMPVVLKRMNDCVARIDNLDSCNGIIIHSAFNRKRTT